MKAGIKRNSLTAEALHGAAGGNRFLQSCHLKSGGGKKHGKSHSADAAAENQTVAVGLHPMNKPPLTAMTCPVM